MKALKISKNILLKNHLLSVNDLAVPEINVLLNRVKTNQKNESRKKLYFSAVASAGLFLFGLIIF